MLYNAQQHAREWLAGETCRRTLDFFVDNYGNTGAAVDSQGNPIAGITAAEVTQLVDTRELWFVCISNPDGFEYTFTDDNRLWRKNMADNDGDGVRGETEDGVDPNRNYSTNWGLDNEGSSDDPTSETYRGTGPASEPETKAMHALWDKVDFVFQKNDHTAAELLLYPLGYQQYTTTPDNGLLEALAGNDDESAIADRVWNDEDETWDLQDNPLDDDTSVNRFDPDLGAELYITNGDTLEDAYDHGILGFTPEGSEPSDRGRHRLRVPGRRERHRGRVPAPPAVLARPRQVGRDPGRAVLAPRQRGAGLLRRGVRRAPTAIRRRSRCRAKRSLGDVRLRYRINDGPVQQASTKAPPKGERFGNEEGIVFQRLRGEVKGTQPGDEVEVWFEASSGPEHSGHFTYTARKESKNNVLVLAAEDYLAGNPAQDPDGPHYLSYYTDALDANGVGYDVYDVDRMGHQAPDSLGVLSHYDAVIWYTGDDYLTRRPGQPPGTGTARLARRGDDRRPGVPQRGRQAALHGQERRLGSTRRATQFRNFGFPEPTARSAARSSRRASTTRSTATRTARTPTRPRRRSTRGRSSTRTTRRSADGCITHNDDFLQYYLGAYIYVSGGNTAEETDEGYFPFNMTGDGEPYGGLTWGFDETGAGNQDHTATFAVTSSLLDPQQYPTFADSKSLASWLRPGAGPFSPFSGQYYMASNAHSGAYKRLRQDHRPHRRVCRRADVQVLLGPRAELGLHDGRGARGRR